MALPPQQRDFDSEKLGDAEKINDLAVSPNGKYLVLSSTGAVRIYTMADKSYVDMPINNVPNGYGAPVVAASNNYVYAVIKNDLVRKSFTDKSWEPFSIALSNTTHIQVSKNDESLFSSHQETLNSFELKRLNSATGEWAEDKRLPNGQGEGICQSFIATEDDVAAVSSLYDQQAEESYPQLVSKAGNELTLAEELGGGEGSVTLQPFDVENTPICLDIAQNSVGDSAAILSYLAGSGQYIDLYMANSGKPPLDEGLASESDNSSKPEKPQTDDTEAAENLPAKTKKLPVIAIILLVIAATVFIGLLIGLRLRKRKNSAGLAKPTDTEKENNSITQKTDILTEKGTPNLSADTPDDDKTIPTARYCKNCGALSLEGASFCNKCGQPLD